MAKNNVFYTVLEVLIAVACCLGNLLVIWAVWTCGAMRRQPTFCLIISLAVADFLVGAVAVPLSVLVDGRVRTSFYGCLLPSCGEIVVTQASIHSLLAIAVDRCLRVYIPHRYKTMMTQKLSWTIVGVCWVSAGILGSVPVFGWNRHDTLEQMEASNSTTITCTFLAVIPMSFMINFNFFACVLPPMLLMMLLYFYILIKMQHLKGSGASSSEFRSYYQKERKLTHSLILILTVFVVCWLPLHFMNMISFYRPQTTVPHEVFYMGILLSQANSAINPVIYALKIQHIRAALMSLWRRLFMCKEAEETHMSSQTPGNASSCNTHKMRVIQDMINVTTTERDE
ncbi:adenosine receptor A1-like [Alosa sapidissima]|uniref:adenosine receptor A1-like n=1 Tax=Alosa sapidissima TaxID=34773 RepID=UPI001C09537A|nr:adenosine receptor A1-like [Alosa sapidissima]